MPSLSIVPFQIFDIHTGATFILEIVKIKNVDVVNNCLDTNFIDSLFFILKTSVWSNFGDSDSLNILPANQPQPQEDVSVIFFIV